MQDFLHVLEEYKKNCERQGKYIEADIAKKRLEELRLHEEDKRLNGLRSRQEAQRLGIEEAHMLEFQQFNDMWDRQMKEYDDRAAELLEAMRQRHELDAAEFGQKKAAEPARKPKHSSELLDLRRIEQVLARQGEYVEAQKVKVRADTVEAAEIERAKVEREQSLLHVEARFLARQEQELSALRQRITSGAEEQRVARQQDLERLLQRYNNIKAELEAQQTAERRRVLSAPSLKSASSAIVLGGGGAPSPRAGYALSAAGSASAKSPKRGSIARMDHVSRVRQVPGR